MLDPLVGESPRSSPSAFGVFHQQEQHEVHRVLGHVRPSIPLEFDYAPDYPSLELLSVRGAERVVPAEQLVRDHAAAPIVAGLVISLGVHLRRHVGGRARGSRKDLASLHVAGEAEIGDFESAHLEGPGLVDQHIVALQVSVANVVLVQIQHAAQNLRHGAGRQGLGQVPSPLGQVTSQCAAGTQLQNQKQVLLVLKDLVQHEQVRMVEHLHDLDLLLDHVALRLGLGLVQNLDGPRGAGGLDLGLPDHAECALAQDLVVELVVHADVVAVLDDELQGTRGHQTHRVRY
mmetsp:Transcript_81559/g.235672  ORF Transcript_81559/g.235672 Transcript_81559/m.235672 type:complete len:289 (-) Transcript_81559:29-895(-)